MNNEVERMCPGLNSKYYPEVCLEGPEDTTKPTVRIVCPGRDSN